MAVDAGTLIVNVIPNTTGFTAKLTASMSKIGSALDAAGISSTTAAIGVAVGTVAVIATKTALQYEQAFTKIDAVSNASAENIAQWKNEVLDLAGETAQSPNELAEGLYFLASAGLKSGQEMEVLTASAKASAAGLGSVADISKISAQALNAYAESGLTAVEVTDVLVQAVKAGTAEPEEFAVALGRVLPIAARAGVEFDEVAASLASLSNIGLNVNEGTTALRGLLQALVAPSGQAAEALAEAGISVDQMRDAISEGGLLSALDLLEKKTGGNIDQLRKIIPNIRALTGELGLTGENIAKVQATFDEVANSTGALDKAFETTTQGPMFAFQQAAAQGEVALIQLGEAFIPLAHIVAEIASGALGALASVISKNTDLLRNLLYAFLAFKAIAFLPALLRGVATALTAMTAAGLTKVATGLFAVSEALIELGAIKSGTAIGNLAAVLPGMAAPLTALAVGAAGLAVWFNILVNSSNALKEETASMTATMNSAGFSLADLQQNLHLSDDGFQQFLGSVRGGTAELSAGAEATENWTLKMKGLLDNILGAQTDLQASTISINSLTGEVTTTVSNAASAYDVYATSLLYAVDLTNEQKLTLAQSIDAFYRLGGALTDNNEAWLQSAIAAGKYGEVSAFLETRITKLREGIGDMDVVTDNQAKNFAQLLEAGDQLASGLGTTFTGLSTAVKAAIDKDGGVIGDNFEKLVGDIQGKVAELRDSIFDAVNFTGQAIGTLSEQALKSPEAILKSFKAAAAATRDFGKDLLEISTKGGKAGKALATNLLASGEAGRTAAATIAGAGDKMRDHLIAAFGSGETAASRVASKLSGTMAAALGDIRTILLQIAKTWGVNVELKDNASGKIKTIQNEIFQLDGTTATVYVNAQGVAHGGGGEFGAYIPGAAKGGFILNNGLLEVGEKNKKEVVLPLENVQGERALAKAMAAAGRSLDGGRVRGGDGGSISGRMVLDGPVTLRVGKTSMDAYISGVARSEDDQQKRYDDRISRMRRD